MVSGAAGASILAVPSLVEGATRGASVGAKEKPVVEQVVKAKAGSLETATLNAAPVSYIPKRRKNVIVMVKEIFIAVFFTYQRTVHSASGVHGASVPKLAVTALSPVTDPAKAKLVEEGL